MSVSDELDQISEMTNQLRDKLRKIPKQYLNVRKDIKEINNKGDRFEQWIQTLPYPLATILKRYKASVTNQQKYDMLLYFFEAYSIFTAAILAAVYQQQPFSDSEVRKIDATRFSTANFGNWVTMDTKLAEVFRKWLSKPERINSLLNGFHTDDQSLIKQLSRKEIYSILDEARKMRNDKAHRGLREDYEKILTKLDTHLNNLRILIEDLFEKIRLVRCFDHDYNEGVKIHKIEILTGSDPIFETEELLGDVIDGDELMDRSKLYIHVIDTNKVFEIPPFLVMKKYPSTIKNACYFYNSLKGNNSEYVSYHIESEPSEIKGEKAFDFIKSIIERPSALDEF